MTLSEKRVSITKNLGSSPGTGNEESPELQCEALDEMDQYNESCEELDYEYAETANIYSTDTGFIERSKQISGYSEDKPILESPRKITPPGMHTVRAGESLYSIARLYKLKAENVWKDPQNTDISKRRDRNILHPGDKIYIPRNESRTENCETTRRHCFKYKIEKVWLRIVMQDDGGNPRSNMGYILHVDGVSKSFEGVTKSEGLIEAQVPATATSGTLYLKPDQPTGEWERMNIYISHLDPIEEMSGVEARLNNLGYRIGLVNGEGGLSTEAAIYAFQLDHDLQVTGKLDEQTIKTLKEIYGC